MATPVESPDARCSSHASGIVSKVQIPTSGGVPVTSPKPAVESGDGRRAAGGARDRHLAPVEELIELLNSVWRTGPPAIVERSSTARCVMSRRAWKSGPDSRSRRDPMSALATRALDRQDLPPRNRFFLARATVNSPPRKSAGRTARRPAVQIYAPRPRWPSSRKKDSVKS